MSRDSSDSDDSLNSNSSERLSDCEESGEEMEIVTGELEPYTDEPVASDGERDDLEDGEDVDLDGLTPAGLETRFEHRVAVQEWLVNCLTVSFRIAIFMFIIYQIHSSLSRRCKCEHCNDETLANALEFRCCHEVTNAIGKLVFDGSIENISCITEHEDYAALTNRTVLLQVAPLLSDKQGRGYRRRAGVTENE